jgi:hypothetical protein
VANRGRGIGASSVRAVRIGFSFCSHATIFPRGGREREEGAPEESEQSPSLYFSSASARRCIPMKSVERRVDTSNRTGRRHAVERM